MNLLINIFLIILIIIVFYNLFQKKENFDIVIPEIIPERKEASTIKNEINFMFYQGTKSRGNLLASKPEFKDNLNELVKVALSIPNCISFTNNGEFYDNFDLCYNKGPTNSAKGQSYDGTYIKSQIFEDYLINNCL